MQVLNEVFGVKEEINGEAYSDNDDSGDKPGEVLSPHAALLAAVFFSAPRSNFG